MKKVLKLLSIIFLIIIPFSTIFYLIYSLLNDINLNIFNGGIVLKILENSFQITISPKLLIIYISIYLILIILTFFSYKLKSIKKWKMVKK
ncbi:hypothetical protein CYK80_15970 [Clostridium perfringens]|nr:hypothetical protein CYK80_15970 [Clostridium perfringens]